MTDFECRATYQGYPVQAFSVDRKPGLTGDFGWIEMALEDVKKITVRDDFRLWQAAAIKEPAGPFTAEVADRLVRPTRTDSPPAVIGFNRGGALKITTLVDGAGSVRGTVTLDPIYLAPSGIDEILEDLADAEAHDQGRVRVNITDIRHFWGDNGTPVFGRYNILLGNGKYDRRTLQKSGKLYTAKQIFNLIALCLPGAPAIHRASEIDALQAPVDVDMEMERPVEWMRRLLEGYGLELHLTLDSQILIVRRGGKHSVGKFRAAPGGTPATLTLAGKPNTEKKTVYVIDRPEAVMVVGGRRQQRITTPLVPVFIDLDGQVKKLDDLPNAWDGYTVEEAKEQIFLRPEKSFTNIPGADMDEKFARARVAQKYFYRLYAPVVLFQPFTLPGLPAVSGNVYWPFEEATHPLLPMLDPWWMPDEVPELRKILPLKKIGVKQKDASLIQTDIVVRANIVKQMRTNEIGPFEQLMARLLAGQQEKAERNTSLANAKARERDRLVNLTKVDEFERMNTLERAGARLQKLGDLILSGIGIVSESVDKILRAQAQFRAQSELDLQRVKTEIDELDRQRKEIQEEISTMRAKLDFTRENIRTFGFARLWVNAPWGRVEQADYTVESDTGLVFFNEICGLMETSGVFDKESTVLLGDGKAEITYSAEMKIGSPTEFSSWTFMQNRSKDGGTPTLVRISEPTNLKPTPIHEPSLVLHENENGEAMNAAPTGEKAARLASALLDGPRQQTGYRYRYAGCWRVITDDAVNEVTWSFDGDQSHTDISANNPDEYASGFASLTRKRHEEELLYGRRR